VLSHTNFQYESASQTASGLVQLTPIFTVIFAYLFLSVSLINDIIYAY